ncbi:MAG: hypothetical protein ACRD3Q_03740 [Terriglobales bacterium]
MHEHFAALRKRVTIGFAGRVIATICMAAMLGGMVKAQGPALTTIREVRYSDTGWAAVNSRNLIGRFTSRSFTLARYARAQSYFLRIYDDSSPAKYSRHSAALFVDYPL